MQFMKVVFMFAVAKDQTTITEQAILRKLRVWIIALAVVCLVAGIGLGAMLSGRPTVAQNEMQISRAPEALSASFAEIARRVEPAVVNIETISTTPEIAEKDLEDKDDQTNPLLDMLRRQPRRPSRGVGSGFIVSPKGYILTNEHVIEGSSRIIIGLQSGEKYRGRVVGVDEETDVAVVKIDAPHDLPTVTLGDSNAAQVGDWVLAMGSPFGLDQTVTAGIISKKERETPGSQSNFQRFLQTDAAINRGNSGGPLVNMRGEVIGINSQIATSTGDYNGIGFALPASEANFVYRQIVSGGKVRRGYLGVTLESVKDEYARVYGLPEAKGAIVMDVYQQTKDEQPTPAAKAGMQSNDIITEFNGQPIANAQDLIQKVAGSPVGESAGFTFLRDREGKWEKHTANVVLGERPPPPLATEDDPAPPKAKESEPKGNALRLGVTLTELTPQLTLEKRLTGVRGLYLKEVDPNGLAAEVRIPGGLPALNEGDVITRINRANVTTLAEFQRVVSGLKPGDPVVLLVTRYVPNIKRVTTRLVQFSYQ
jgi:serine protease Do